MKKSTIKRIHSRFADLLINGLQMILLAVCFYLLPGIFLPESLLESQPVPLPVPAFFVCQWSILLLMLLQGFRMTKRQYDFQDVILADCFKNTEKQENAQEKMCMAWQASKICARGTIALFFLLAMLWLSTWGDLKSWVLRPPYPWINPVWEPLCVLTWDTVCRTILLILIALLFEIYVQISLQKFSPLPKAEKMEFVPPYPRPLWYFLSCIAGWLLLAMAIIPCIVTVYFGDKGNFPFIFYLCCLYGIMAYFESASRWQHEYVDLLVFQCTGKRKRFGYRAFRYCFFLLLLLCQFGFLEYCCLKPVNLFPSMTVPVKENPPFFTLAILLQYLMLIRQMWRCKFLRKRLHSVISVKRNLLFEIL